MGYFGDSFISNSLLGVYARGLKEMASAHKLFDEMSDREMACCWTSLIAGYAQMGLAEKAMLLFFMMVKENIQPEDDTIVSVLSACSKLQIAEIEKWVVELRQLVNKCDSKRSCCDSINIVLIYLYGKWGMVEKSEEKFNEVVDKRSVLVWNSMINAYFQNGFPVEALTLFRLMVENPHCKPNHVTMVTVISACAQIGDLQLGSWVHEVLQRGGRKGHFHRYHNQDIGGNTLQRRPLSRLLWVEWALGIYLRGTVLSLPNKVGVSWGGKMLCEGRLLLLTTDAMNVIGGPQ